MTLPFDSGVAAGRNAALAEVETEFVMSVDDDFVFTRELDLNRVVTYLRQNPEVDVVGGLVINLPLWQAPDYSKARLFAYRGEPVRPAGTVVDGLPVLYKVPQFFIARTERLRLVKWDENLKRVDHNDFFTRAFRVLLTVYDKRFDCLQAQPKIKALPELPRRLGCRPAVPASEVGLSPVHVHAHWATTPQLLSLLARA